MKKSFFTLLLCFGLMMSYGQALKVAADGNVGIGASNPARSLHIRGNNAVFRLDRFGNSAPGFLLSNQTNGGISEKNFFFGVPAAGTNDGYFFIGDYGTAVSGASTRRFVVDNDGDVIIGTSTSTMTGYKLTVEGRATKTVGGDSWNSLSDRRVKRNINDFNSGLDYIMKMKTVDYEYNGKGGTEDGEYQIGVIAQDLKEIAPFMVQDIEFKFDDGLEYMDAQDRTTARTARTENYLTVNASAVKWMLVNAVQEQQRLIEEKEAQIEDLESRLQRIEDLLGASDNSDIGSIAPNNVQKANLSSINLASVDQNNPNPFNTFTSINYSLPKDAINSTMEVFDVTGQLIKSIRLEGTGKGVLELKTDELNSGIYSYRLVVDGEVIGSSKMIKSN